MTTKVQKWGNSLAVRLPKEVAQKLHLKEGSKVEVRQDAAHIVIQHVGISDKEVNKKAWKRFVISTKNKKENVAVRIDEILYGASS